MVRKTPSRNSDFMVEPLGITLLLSESPQLYCVLDFATRARCALFVGVVLLQVPGLVVRLADGRQFGRVRLQEAVLRVEAEPLVVGVGAREVVVARVPPRVPVGIIIDI